MGLLSELEGPESWGDIPTENPEDWGDIPTVVEPPPAPEQDWQTKYPDRLGPPLPASQSKVVPNKKYEDTPWHSANDARLAENLAVKNVNALVGLAEVAARQNPTASTLITEMAEGAENPWTFSPGWTLMNHLASGVVKETVDVIDMLTTDDVREEVIEASKIIREESAAILGDPNIKYQGNAGTKFGYEVAEAAVNMGGAIAVGFVTKNAKLALGVIGAQVGGATYQDYMEKTGGDHDKSALAAKFHVLAEIIPESIPVFAILRKTKAGEGIRRMIEATLGEGVQEGFTSILTQAYDNNQLENMSLKDAILGINLADVAYEAAIGTMVGATLASPGAVGDYMESRKAREAPFDPDDDRDLVPTEGDPFTPDFNINTLEANAEVISELIDLAPDLPEEPSGDVSDDAAGFIPIDDNLEEADAELQAWAQQQARLLNAPGEDPGIPPAEEEVNASKLTPEESEQPELQDRLAEWDAILDPLVTTPEAKEPVTEPTPKEEAAEELSTKGTERATLPAEEVQPAEPLPNPELDAVEAELEALPKNFDMDSDPEVVGQVQKLLRKKRDLTDQRDHGLTPKQNRLERDRLMEALYEKSTPYGKFDTITEMREKLGGKGTTPKQEPPTRDKLRKEGLEYEGRLWGGSYGVGYLNKAAKDAPKRKMIAAARKRYNEIRKEAGLSKVTDWNTRPEELVQRLGQSDEITPAEVKAATEPVEKTGEAIDAAETYRTARPAFEGLILSFKPGDKRGDDTTTHYYGEIAETEDKDGMPIDVVLNKNYQKTPVDAPAFIVNQKDWDTGEFRQHKVMAGFKTLAAARKGYADMWDKKGIQDIHELSHDEFQEWRNTGDHKVEYKPGAEETTAIAEDGVVVVGDREYLAPDKIPVTPRMQQAFDAVGRDEVLALIGQDVKPGHWMGEPRTAKGIAESRSVNALSRSDPKKWPQPNESGVYDKDDKRTEYFKFPALKTHNIGAEAWVLEAYEGIWINSVKTKMKDGGSVGPLSASGNDTFESREAALRNAFDSLKRFAAKNPEAKGIKKFNDWLDAQGMEVVFEPAQAAEEVTAKKLTPEEQKVEDKAIRSEKQSASQKAKIKERLEISDDDDLITWIRKEGGLNVTNQSDVPQGSLIHLNKKLRMIGLSNIEQTGDKGLSLSDITEKAWGRGFIAENDEALMSNLLLQAAEGKPIYSHQRSEKAQQEEHETAQAKYDDAQQDAFLATEADNWADVVKGDKNLSKVSPETARLMSLAGAIDHEKMVDIASKEMPDTDVQTLLQALINEKTGKTTTEAGSEAADKTGGDDVKVKSRRRKKKPFPGETTEDIESFPWQEYADHYDVEIMDGSASLEMDARTYVIDVYSDKGRLDFVRRVYASNYDQFRKVEKAYSDKYGTDTFIEVTKTAPEHDRDSMPGIIANQNVTQPYTALRPIVETENQITGGKVSKKAKVARGELLQKMGFLTKSQWDRVASEYKHLLTAPKSDKVVKTWGEEFKNRPSAAEAQRTYISHAEGKAKIAEWKAHAKAIGKKGGNSQKVILFLFEDSGVTAQPWIDAGYDVRAIDLKRDGVDIRDIDYGWLLEMGFLEGDGIWGIFAACPCQKFTNTTARDRKPGKERPGVKGGTDFIGDTHSAVDLVEHTLDVAGFLKPRWFALENPLGRIQDITNVPNGLLSFNPNNFGDPYTKKTVLHGHFNPNLPTANVDPRVEHGGEGSKIQTTLGSKDEITQGLRSITPEGFAYAFFMANNDTDYSIHEELAQEYIENFAKKGSFRGTPLEDQVRMGWILGAHDAESSGYVIDDAGNSVLDDFYMEDIGDLPIEVQAAIEDGRDFHNDEDGWLISDGSMSVAEQRAMEQKLRSGIDAKDAAAFKEAVGDATPNTGTKKEKVVLIACCQKKSGEAAPAKDLYQSPLFKAQLEYAESLGADRIMILSAEHGPVELGQVLEPYDTSMKKKTAEEKKNWARVAYNKITSAVNPNGSEFIFLAGKDYRGELSKLLAQHPAAKIDVPFEGLGIGSQLAALKDTNKMATGGFVYHATFTNKVAGIKKEGIKPMQTSNWVKPGGKRYNEDGGIFAFGSAEAAFKWAHKMQFDLDDKKISVVKVRDTGDWQPDPASEMGQFTNKDKSFKKQSAVQAADIVGSMPISELSTAPKLGIKIDEWFARSAKALEALGAEPTTEAVKPGEEWESPFAADEYKPGDRVIAAGRPGSVDFTDKKGKVWVSLDGESAGYGFTPAEIQRQGEAKNASTVETIDNVLGFSKEPYIETYAVKSLESIQLAAEFEGKKITHTAAHWLEAIDERIKACNKMRTCA